jgi:hypothetical protein
MINQIKGFALLFSLLLSTTSAFQLSKLFHSRLTVISSTSSNSDDKEVIYDSLAVSGFLSKENNFAEASIVSKLFATKKWKGMTGITDNIKFARKRMMSPLLINSGLMDVMDFVEVDTKIEDSLQSALQGKEVWLSFNITSVELPVYADQAVKAGLKRAIFAVNVADEESGEGGKAAWIRVRVRVRVTFFFYINSSHKLNPNFNPQPNSRSNSNPDTLFNPNPNLVVIQVLHTTL